MSGNLIKKYTEAKQRIAELGAENAVLRELYESATGVALGKMDADGNIHVKGFRDAKKAESCGLLFNQAGDHHKDDCYLKHATQVFSTVAFCNCGDVDMEGVERKLMDQFGIQDEAKAKEAE